MVRSFGAVIFVKGLFKQVVRMRFPIGIQNFRTLREDGYLYIDKTELIYKLVDTGCYYLLRRPRRFGKSLLVSTLEAYCLRKDRSQGRDIGGRV